MKVTEIENAYVKGLKKARELALYIAAKDRNEIYPLTRLGLLVEKITAEINNIMGETL